MSLPPTHSLLDLDGTLQAILSRAAGRLDNDGADVAEVPQAIARWLRSAEQALRSDQAVEAPSTEDLMAHPPPPLSFGEWFALSSAVAAAHATDPAATAAWLITAAASLEPPDE